MKNNTTKTIENLIIGAGPAGLQMAYFLAQKKRDYLVIEAANRVGAFFSHFPRSGKLVSFNKKYSIYEDPVINERWDWNSLLTEDHSFGFAPFSEELFPSASEMHNYLNAFCQNFDLNVITGCQVIRISRNSDGEFLILSPSHTFRAARIFIATGLQKPHVPTNIPGIELAGGYETASFDPKDYRGKRVLIIGKGNSGFELAETILSTASLVHIASPNRLKLAWMTKHSGDLRAQYTSLIDTYQLKTLHSVLDGEVRSIRPHKNGQLRVEIAYTHAEGETEQLCYDSVIRATGFCFDPSIFDQTCQQTMVLSGRFPKLSPYWESASTPGLFFIGTTMQERDFKTTSSAFIGGFRYNIRSLHQLIEERHYGSPRPVNKAALSPQALSELIIARLATASALWIQFGYLCDVIYLNPQTLSAYHYQELPIQYAIDPSRSFNRNYIALSFEYGQNAENALRIERKPSHIRAAESQFLHPVLRHYRDHKQVAEHHLLEDLLGMYSHEQESGTSLSRSGKSMQEYHRKEHIAPLQDFLAQTLAQYPELMTPSPKSPSKNTNESSLT